MKFHEICGNEHAKRAAEVALAGDHTIAFIGPPQGDAWAFSLAVEQAHKEVSDLRDTRLAFHWQPCPCGEACGPEYVCLCDSIEVRAWQQMHPMPAADIHVAVLRPPTPKLMGWARAGFCHGPEHGSILARVASARATGMHGPNDFSDVAWSLLKAATAQLVLESGHVRSVVAVAQTVARLAGANQVEAQHMAEAVQYRPRGREFRPSK